MVVAEYDYVGGGSLAFGWSGPVFQIAGPGKVGKDHRIPFRVAGENILERLQVSCGRRESGQVDEFCERAALYR